ncbi:hypothetical protein KCU83_g325, partial [Aureobasidium melanogenum]
MSSTVDLVNIVAADHGDLLSLSDEQDVVRVCEPDKAQNAPEATLDTQSSSGLVAIVDRVDLEVRCGQFSKVYRVNAPSVVGHARLPSHAWFLTSRVEFSTF